MARDLLHERDGALADGRDRDRLGAHAVARDATDGMAEFRVFSPISPLSGLRIHGSGGLP